MINLFSLSCEREYSLMPYQIMNLPTIDFVNPCELVINSRRGVVGCGEARGEGEDGHKNNVVRRLV